MCAIVPHTFKPQNDLLKQGNYYQYDIMGKYHFICKTTWHNNFSHKKEDEREHAHSEHVHGASDRHIKSHQAESAGSAAAGDDGTQ